MIGRNSQTIVDMKRRTKSLSGSGNAFAHGRLSVNLDCFSLLRGRRGCQSTDSRISKAQMDLEDSPLRNQAILMDCHGATLVSIV